MLPKILIYVEVKMFEKYWITDVVPTNEFILECALGRVGPGQKR